MLSAIQSIPKADLHVHLEGTVTPQTLQLLARKNKISLSAPTTLPGFAPVPAPSAASLSGNFGDDFFEFIKLYLKISSAIKSADDILYIADEYGRAAARESVVCAEVYVTPTTLCALGLDEAALADGLRRAEKHVKSKYQLTLKWIFDIVRNSPLPGEDTVEIATRLRDSGVCVHAIGLAGLEKGHGALRFGPAFKVARDREFKIYAHAGETAGADSLRETLREIRPARIGHGIRVLEDAQLVKELIDSGAVLEVCPWSNIKLGVSEEASHPLNDLLAKKIPLILASDDPGIFGKTLSENYLYALERGVSMRKLKMLAEKSVELSRLR